MQKRLFQLSACLLFTWSFAIAQKNQQTEDSIFFENFFARYQTQVQANRPVDTDSLEKIRELAIAQKMDGVISRYFLEKAALYLQKRQNDSALHCYQQSIAFAKKQDSKRELGNALIALANYYQYNGNTIGAAESFVEAISLLNESGRKRASIGLYVNLYTILNRLQQKNATLSNSISAVQSDKKNASDLAQIINNSSSEEVGFSFPDNTLLKEAGRDGIYVILGNAKFAIVSLEIMGKYGSFREVQRIPPGTLSRISDFPRNGSLLREFDDGNIYVWKKDSLYQVFDFEVLETYGGWDGVYFVPPGSLEKFPKSQQKVTMDNRYSIFNFGQEFDIIADSIRTALARNTLLSNQLSKAVSARNNALQKRKSLLWISIIGAAALFIISFLLLRNLRQRKKIYRQQVKSLEKEKQLEQYQAVVEAKEEERNRISQDLHDDLGAGITRIKFLSENISEQLHNEADKSALTKLKNSSNELVEKMSEIIWAMNEKNNSWEDLIIYLRSYAMEYCNENNLICKFEMPQHLPTTLAGGETRRNVFLIMKECLHNIVKHAHASTVNISIDIHQAFNMTIQDNGKGMEINSQLKKGNGLINMQKRAKNIGGELVIKNQNGTGVFLSVPI